MIDFKKIKNKFKNIELEVGYFEGLYENGTSVASVAFWNEYGTDKMPSRPFMRNSVSENKNKWSKVIEKSMKAGNDYQKSLAFLGEITVSDVKKSITKGDFTALSESTIKAKGFEKQLVNTGTMLRSVDWRIK